MNTMQMRDNRWEVARRMRLETNVFLDHALGRGAEGWPRRGRHRSLCSRGVACPWMARSAA